MSEATPSSRTTITPRHYQALSGLALSGIILLQLLQSTLAAHIVLVVSVLVGFIGIRALYYRAHISPMLVLLAIAVPYAVEQFTANQSFGPQPQEPRIFEIADVLLCVFALAYFIGHYRLNGLWHGVLPADSRVPAPAAGEAPAPPRVRSEESLSVAELAALVFTVPLFAMLAEFAFFFLSQNWVLFDLPARWRPVLIVSWTVLLAMFLAAHAFRYWRRLQMDRVSAMLMLQDILWHDTRGEQRRLNRWIAWKKLREKKDPRGTP